MIGELPQDDFIARPNLVERREEVAAELADLQEDAQEATGATVEVTFDGPPVGYGSVDARFAGEALTRFEKALALVRASQVGQLSSMGPIPRLPSRLHITGAVHGSFGFALEEVGTMSFLDTPLREALDEMRSLLDLAAQSDADEFYEETSEVDPRAIKALGDFVGGLSRYDASVSLASDTWRLQLRQSQVHRAAETLENVEVEDESVVDVAKILGILPEGRRFELRIGEEFIDGRIDLKPPTEVQGVPDLLWLSEQFSGKAARVFLLKRTRTKGQQQRTSWILRWIVEQ